MYCRFKCQAAFQRQVNELETKDHNQNVRCSNGGIRKPKKGYQPRNNLLQDEDGVARAHSHCVLNRQNNQWCELLDLRGVNYKVYMWA